MNATSSSDVRQPVIRIERLSWPGRDAEVVRIFVGDAPSRHEVFDVAVSGTAIAVLRNHGVEFDSVRDAETYLACPGVLASLLRESLTSREKEPDKYYERAFTWRDLGEPIRAGWMR